MNDRVDGESPLLVCTALIRRRVMLRVASIARGRAAAASPNVSYHMRAALYSHPTDEAGTGDRRHEVAALLSVTFILVIFARLRRDHKTPRRARSKPRRTA